jgi:hypothetical protein
MPPRVNNRIGIGRRLGIEQHGDTFKGRSDLSQHPHPLARYQKARTAATEASDVAAGMRKQLLH